MANKMLIDAAHPEETRVVVLRGQRVEEFDHESLNRRQLRGNIYLAKVTRVEPSLQAAFVDFGGNRHGFLAFSEIHPDYYQIPVADRQALLEEEAEEASRAEAEEAENDEREENTGSLTGDSDPSAEESGENDDVASESQEPTLEENNSDDEVTSAAGEDGPKDIALTADLDATITSDKEASSDSDEEASDERTTEENTETSDDTAAEHEPDQLTHNADEFSDASDENDDTSEDDAQVEAYSQEESDDAEEKPAKEPTEGVESVGSEDVLEEVPHRARRRRRSYKIQEVIKRRQIILVQVVKEERGNKGAALTTYLSLAGRYTVLMPNTARGGGISRKITNHTDRKRLRKIANELEVPQGMGLIIRTAGASRTKAEIKRDFEYLLRLWENVRDLTLQSTAPSLVYEEGSLIKRSIRDLYSKEIDEVLVAGDDAYREAKDFMRMLMPSHAKNVQPYRDPDPLFVRHRIERQLNSMFSPYVTLRSGGYIVINQTEALVSIDVNSGKATREHSIEDTALKTNLEAADEIARQLRLRDLAGLIVIDFIDMDERRNNRSVERKMKDCLRNDRARIQIGRISHFGLLEMSRQRLRTGVLEGSTVQCPHCQGTGMMRSTESVSLTVLRALEDALLVDPSSDLSVTTSIEVALYILNQKRPYLKDIEARYGADIAVTADDTLHGANFTVARINRSETGGADSTSVVQMDWAHHEPHADGSQGSGSDNRRSRRRRGRGRGRGSSDYNRSQETSETSTELTGQSDDVGSEQQQEARQERGNRRSRRRGRRGGRRNRGSSDRQEFNLEAQNGEDGENLQEASHNSEQVHAADHDDQSSRKTMEQAGESVQITETDDQNSQPDKSTNDTPGNEIDAKSDDEAEKAEKEKTPKKRGRKPKNAKKEPKSKDRAKSAKSKVETDKETTPVNGNNTTDGQEKPQSDQASSEVSASDVALAEKPDSTTNEKKGPKRGGWWQRRT